MQQISQNIWHEERPKPHTKSKIILSGFIENVYSTIEEAIGNRNITDYLCALQEIGSSIRAILANPPWVEPKQMIKCKEMKAKNWLTPTT